MKKYRIRAQNIETNKIKTIEISCYNITNVVRALGKYNWCVQLYYPIYKGVN